MTKLNDPKVTAGLPPVPSISGGKRPQISASGAAARVKQGGNGLGQMGSHKSPGKRPL